MYKVNFNRKNKYNATSTEYGGFRYDSKMEAGYAAQLDWRVKAGEIQSWTRQVKLDLKINGRHITNYYCDFKVINKHGGVEFHETKGFSTDLFRIKWKILEAIIDEIEPGAELVLIK